MAAKPTKKQLLDKLVALGVDASAEMTVAQLQKLLKEAESEPAKAEEAPESPKKIVKCGGFNALNIRLGPSKSAPVIGELADGAEVAVKSVDGQWARLERGYCMAKYLV